ncbi:MAG: endonuclease III [Nanoarchaeota archaeon]|nr:endonuclease III [Nanoarchaeota archaeon]
MDNNNLDSVISILKKEFKKLRVPIVTEVSWRKDAFHVLTSCILSLRTKNETTAKAFQRFQKIANTPKQLMNLSVKEIEKAIYPVGFYITKAKRLKEIGKVLVKKYNSKVPDDIDELLKLNGVGRKTANLVVALGYGGDGICVDTHVHRISNRLGYVKTKNPYETEMALRKKLPKKYWIIYNDLLVAWGQNICVPISPWCIRCPIAKYCKRVGVGKSR